MDRVQFVEITFSPDALAAVRTALQPSETGFGPDVKVTERFSELAECTIYP